jgi:hypothetical protein
LTRDGPNGYADWGVEGGQGRGKVQRVWRHQIAPRRTTAGTVDLTTATRFVKAFDTHAKICDHARNIDHLVPWQGTRLNLGSIFEMFFRALHALHTMWAQQTLFTPADLDSPGLVGWNAEGGGLARNTAGAPFPLGPPTVPNQASHQYFQLVTRFGDIWAALKWKVSTWVHWVVCHSHALAVRHRNFYMFSSIPTERRNVEFKLDVTHCFKGWKISRPHACTRGFALVLDLAALDTGLLLEAARAADQEIKRKRQK